MLSPSDFNNAVPQFTNGNYASNPINPQYIAEPDAESYNRGTEPLQTLPAQWWNWFVNKFTARFNKVNIYVKNIFNELAQVLSIFNITPDGTEQTPTTSQLKTVFETCYPQYVKTQTTGTAAGCIPTVGTALGTTNNNILVTDSTGKLKPSGITVGTAAGCDASCFRASNWVPSMLQRVEGEVIYCAWMECGNTLNITPANNKSWINYKGGSACTIIGNGVGDNGYGTLIADTFCGNLAGNATSSSTIYVNSYSDNYNFDIALTNSNAGGNQPLFASKVCPLNFNTSTGYLTAAGFIGSLHGNADTASYAYQATGPIPFDAAEEARQLGARVRAVVAKGITEEIGYRSRMAIGLMYCGAWAHGLISVGCNDDGTAWDDFIFPVGHGGTVVTSTTIGSQSVNRACCANSVTAFEVNGWIARCEFLTGYYCFAYNPNGYPILALIPNTDNSGGCYACVIPACSCIKAVTSRTSGAGIVLRT